MTKVLDAAVAADPDAEESVDFYELALKLRVPVFPRGTNARAKVEQLEEFMLLSAWYQGELNEEMVNLIDEAAPHQDEWDKLEGWESYRQGRTDESVNAAKRVIREDLWDVLQSYRRRVRALKNEIDRLERDASKVSRAYTMLSGG